MINNVVLVGRLTKDCDLKYTSSGTAVGTFTLAVNRQFTNQAGEREADFINCVIWRKSAENFANLRDTNMSRLSYVIDAIREYLETPLSEREEEKRYWLRLATKIDVYEDRRYLNMDIPNEKYTLSENKDDAYYKAIFTESEITEMDITGFERIEVTP